MIVWEFEKHDNEGKVSSRALFSSKHKAETFARQQLCQIDGHALEGIYFDYIENTAAIKTANGFVLGWIVQRNVR